MINPTCLFLLLLAPVLVLADASYDWEIGYVPDVTLGSQSRRAIGVNSVWPPPALHVNEGETLRIRVKNGLDVPTSLHSHGLFQVSYFPRLFFYLLPFHVFWVPVTIQVVLPTQRVVLVSFVLEYILLFIFTN
jgi:FtsP/CotA-like multicopper oxidase with cupredoxin domain